MQTDRSTVTDFQVRISGGGKDSQVFLASCRMWGKRGTIIERFAGPGRMITLVGRPTNFKLLENKEGGEGMLVFNLDVTDFALPEKMPQTENSGYKPKFSKPAESDLPDDEDVPF